MTVRRAVIAASLLLLAAAALAAAWYYRRPQVPSPTEGAWTAVVVPRLPDGASRAPATGRRNWRSSPTRSRSRSRAAGACYVADGGDSNRIRAIDGGRVFTVAGGRGEGFDDGPGRDARFHTPSGIAVADDGTVYVADTGNHRIRRISG